MLSLRPYQLALKADVFSAWNQGAKNVLMRLDTGGGKTVILADIVRERGGFAAVIAHRNELVSQLSMALARVGILHRIIAAKKVAQAITREQIAEFGRAYVDPSAPVGVVSVDTLNRASGLESWLAQVTTWIVDEGHHLLRDNKWGRAVSRFSNPHALGLLPTATPSRADGAGLGRHADGLADVMVEGPPMSWMIGEGFLTDYEVVCPESDLSRFLDDVGKSGDWSQAQLRRAAQRSQIIGDVVKGYLTFAAGRLGITFSTDVETAKGIAQRFNEAGVPAAVLTGDTEYNVRRDLLRRYERREILQLVTVDVVSEGFDLPAIEVGCMARPTMSLALYMQQFGRILRPMPGKGKALLIDHVGNFLKHRGPDLPRVWTLDRREKRSSGEGGAIPKRVCANVACCRPYDRIFDTCPYCGTPAPEPEGRSSPEMVDGALSKLDPEVLARLRGLGDERDLDPISYQVKLQQKHVPSIAIPRLLRQHLAAQEAQAELRARMAEWGGFRRAEGLTDDQIQRRFFFEYGLDVLTARGLGATEARALAERIRP